MRWRAAAALVLLLLVGLIPLHGVAAAGGGITLDAAAVVVEGADGVGAGEVRVLVPVAERTGQSANATLQLRLTTLAGGLLVDRLEAISLEANETAMLNLSLGTVPIGQHRLELILSGEVGTNASANGSDWRTDSEHLFSRLAPADVAVGAPGGWAVTALDGDSGSASGNASLQDGDLARIVVRVSNSGDVAWNGSLQAWLVQNGTNTSLHDDALDLAPGGFTDLNVTTPRLLEGEVAITVATNGTTDPTPADDAATRSLTVGPPPLATPVLTLWTATPDPALASDVLWFANVSNLGAPHLSGDLTCTFPSAGSVLHQRALELAQNASSNASFNVTARPGTLHCEVTSDDRLDPTSVVDATHRYAMAAPTLEPATSEVLTLRGPTRRHAGDAMEASVLVHNAGDATGSARLIIQQDGRDDAGSVVAIGAGSSVELTAGFTLGEAGTANLSWRVDSADSLVVGELSGEVAFGVAAAQVVSLSIAEVTWDAETGVAATVTIAVSDGPTRTAVLVGGSIDGDDRSEFWRQPLTLRPGTRTIEVDLGIWSSGDGAWFELEPSGWAPAGDLSDERSITAPRLQALVEIASLTPESPVRGGEASMAWRLEVTGTDALPPATLEARDGRDGRSFGTADLERLEAGAIATGTIALSDWPGGAVDLELVWVGPDGTRISGELSVLSAADPGEAGAGDDPFVPLGIGAVVALVLLGALRLMRGGPDEDDAEAPARTPSRGTGTSASTASSDRREIACPECDSTLRVPSDHAGAVRCPSCRHVFDVTPEDSTGDEDSEDRAAGSSAAASSRADAPAESAGDGLLTVTSETPELACPVCSQRLRVALDKRPTKARCPACRTIFRAET